MGKAQRSLRPSSLLLIPVVSSIALFAATAADPAAAPEALMAAGHWKRARALLEPLVSAKPQNPELLWALSRTKFAFRDFEGALPLAERAVALDPRSPVYHAQLAAALGRIAQRSPLLKQISLARRCKKELETALALNPNYLNALEGMKGYLWNAPGIVGGDKNKAREIAARMTAIDPVRGLLNQAEIATWEHDSSKAADFYRTAVETHPGNYDALWNLAAFEAQEKPPALESAERHAVAAEALAPDRAGAYTVLARVYAEQGRTAELEQLLLQAEQNVPDDLAPRLAAADALREQGHDLTRAEAYARAYLEQEAEGEEPSVAWGRWRLALILEKEGRGKEALAEMQSAARLEPENEALARDLKRLKR